MRRFELRRLHWARQWGTNAPLANSAARPKVRAMKKRVLSTLLWFYAGWTLGSLLSFSLGISPAIGPILGAAVSALFVGDPRRIIWSKVSSPRSNLNLER